MAKSRKRLNRRHIRSRWKHVNRLALDEQLDLLVNESYRMESPPILYHYTDWGAAKGILCEKHFWETAHDCTNDEAEIKSAHSVIVEVAKTLRAIATGAAVRALDFFIDTYPQLQLDKMKTVYLSCFSLARDDEKQWKNYADDSRGLCLAVKVLKEPSPTPADRASALIQVDYSEDSWRKHLMTNFAKVCDLLSRVANTKRTLELASSALYRIAAIASIRAKQPQWSAEKEVRHVTFLQDDAKAKPKERKRGDKTIRYLDDVELRMHGKQLSFAEIIIGPNQDNKEAQSRLIALLTEAGYHVETPEYPAITASQSQPWQQKAAMQ
jgi:hypothetical protein